MPKPNFEKADGLGICLHLGALTSEVSVVISVMCHLLSVKLIEGTLP